MPRPLNDQPADPRVAEAIEAILEVNSWTVLELANELGLSAATVYRLRKGSIKRIPHQVTSRIFELAAGRGDAAHPGLEEEIRADLQQATQHLLMASAKFAILERSRQPAQPEKTVPVLPVDNLSRRAREALGSLDHRAGDAPLEALVYPTKRPATQGRKSTPVRKSKTG